ncbi:hypothetical protein [Phenylobacterium sp.]|jgi:hypothetical protein|uniref:hypothetical protein n=1 Tax=Phenylobacterium sp. TaxID=1871053 RepID=UPI002F41FE18
MKIPTRKWPKAYLRKAAPTTAPSASRDGRSRDERLADLLRLAKPAPRPQAS